MSTKKVLGVAVVAALALGGGKLYFDHQAKEIFDQKVAELKKENPDMNVESSSVSYNPFSDMVVINDLKLKNKSDLASEVNIGQVSYTHFDSELKSFPLNAEFNVVDLKIKLSDMNFESKDDEILAKHLAGSKEHVSFSSFSKSSVDVAKNSISLSSSFAVERLGNSSLVFDLGGVYQDIDASLKAGDYEKYQKNPMELLSKASLSNISFSITSNGFKDTISALNKAKGLKEEDMLSNINKSIESLKSSEKEKFLVPHVTVIRDALEKDKEIFFEVKVNRVINQDLVMSLFMDQSALSTPSMVQKTFGIEINSSVK